MEIFQISTTQQEWKKKEGSCASYGVDEDGEETYQCDFEGITAENGYIKRDVTFVVIDKTAKCCKRKL